MAPRGLRENASKAVGALHSSTLPRSRQLAGRSASGWACGDTRRVKTCPHPCVVMFVPRRPTAQLFRCVGPGGLDHFPRASSSSRAVS
eukprot:8311469-Pyramimonas_sp.AAC.1